MNSILKQMITRYDASVNKISAIKQVIQECVLSSLSHTDFFEFASFYGGTALRLFYGLDRFSEDLDFSLKEKNIDFSIDKYLKDIESNLKDYGLIFTATEKQKSVDTNIISAFLKGNTKETIISFDIEDDTIDKKELIKIKFEVDVLPPDGANFEDRYILLPNNSCINVYDEKSLFAGKLHAVICRAWKNRVKGRDLYDYLFYLTRRSTINYLHLKNRLFDSGYLEDDIEINAKETLKMLLERFDAIDFEEAKEDILPFIDDKHKIDVWNKDLFVSVTKDYFCRL